MKANTHRFTTLQGASMVADDVLAGARTVAQMADYFRELRARADRLRAGLSASTRGYFTPTEDDAVRQLLVSYWQSRNALLDLVLSFRRDAALPDELRPAAFLVAYAAAVLLVDAARYLRELCDDLPTVREKLNEPEPSFGIPACVYDTVQHSLTSSRNAWHLYHAMHYFDEHEPQLRELGKREELRPVMAVIDALGHRVRVPGGRYLNARTRVRVRGALDGLRRDVVSQALYGLQKFMGCLASELRVRPNHCSQLPEPVRRQLGSLLRPGDVLVTRKEYAVTNYFLPGYWPHAALYLGGAEQLSALGLATHENLRPRWERLLACSTVEPGRVLESLKDGVRIRSLESPLGSDSLVVLRPRLHSDDIAAALGRGMFHEGKPYDFDFDFSRSDRLVCTEVVYRSYEGIGDVRFELLRRAGRLTLSAEDLIAMAVRREHFEPIAVYAPALADGLLEELPAQEFLSARFSAAQVSG